jgi:putative PEP-CTERM system histidine kinase
MLAKHFFPYRYDYRDEWQKLTRALSQSDETPVYERIATVMAGSVNCGCGGLWLRDSEGVFVPVGGDLAVAGAPVESGHDEFLEYLRVKEWIFDLDAARGPHPRKDLPGPPQWMLANTNIWLVVPLVCEETLVGFVALSQPLAQMRLTWEEIDLLRAAGRQVAGFLALEEAARRLAEARQFEALNRVSAVLMHDLRHLVAQQALVVQNAARHRGNPAFFDDAILTIDNSVKRMNRLMDELRSGIAMDQTQCINLVELCVEAVERCGSRVPAPTLTSHDRCIEIVAKRDRMLHVIEHVVRNAQDATPPSGAVSVELRRTGRRAVIEVKDTGTGMDPEFIRHRLFRPFDTTKGEQGMGIGAYEVRKLVLQCGGKVEVDSSPGRGTKFTISLPLTAAPPTRNDTIRDELQTS